MTRARGGRVRLDVLGRIELSADGREVRGLLVQPKRVALLAWIVLRRPGGFVRRDEALGVFWPESSEDRARASLRQALQFIRRHLGPDVLVSRGTDEIGIDARLFSCDALEFLDAMHSGDDAGALESYGGDLLPAFHLEGAPEFERWSNSERQRLRACALEVALRAADQAEQAGDYAAAAHRLAWGQQLEPTDESVARRHMCVLERSGNPAAALAVYDNLAERLRTALELEPSARTTELFARIRDDAAMQHPGAAGDERDARSAAVGPRLSPQRVLVLELENRTGDDRFALLGSLAAETLARGLADLPDLVVVPPLAVGPVRPSSEEPALGAAPAAAAALARRAGAGTLLDGSVHREGNVLWFRVRATDVAAGRLLPGLEPVRVDESMPLEGIERLREHVVTAIAPALTQRVVHVRTASRPPAIDAYSAYVDGLERFVAGDWAAALERFRRSVALAPDYALPRVVSAIALWNLGKLEQAHATALEGDALRATLGRFERAVLDMVLAWLAGDWAAAHRAALAQADMAPGSIPHFQVAEESRRLNHPRQAREVLGRLDPESGELRGWIFYWVELAAANHLLRDHARELEVASRCRRLHPHELMAALLETRALAALRRDRDVNRIVEQVLASPAGGKPAAVEFMIETALELRTHGSEAAGAALMEQAVDWQRSALHGLPEEQRLLARALYHDGEFDEAWSIFVELAATSRGRVQHVGLHHVQLSAHLDEGFLAAIAARRGDAAAADEWCAFLRDLDTRFLYGAHWYWLAVVAAIRNDSGQAVRMLRRAFADGMPMELFLHTDPHLAPLRSDTQLDALLRPRG